MSMFSEPPCGRCWDYPCECTPEQLAADAERERLKSIAARAMTPEQWAASIVVPRELLKGPR